MASGVMWGDREKLEPMPQVNQLQALCVQVIEISYQ